MAILQTQNFQRPFCRDLFAAGVLLGALWLAGCENSPSAQNFQLERSSKVKVNVFRPERVENASLTASYFGKLKANQSSSLGFVVGGNLTFVAQPQQKFASGEPIAGLDVTELTEQVTELEQQLASQPESSRNSSRNTRMENQIAGLQTQIRQRSILAPFDCIVERTFAQENSLVRPNSPIVTIVETTTPKIEINLPRRIVKLIDNESDYVFVLDGQNIRASVRERAFTENPPGNLRMVFDIKTNLSELDFYLEQIVEARFSFPSQKAGYWLPLGCLQQASDGAWFVLAIESEGQQNTVRRQVVEIVQLRDDAVLVADGLPEQFIVRDGVHRVVPSQQVELNLVKLDSSLAGSMDAVDFSEPPDLSEPLDLGESP